MSKEKTKPKRAPFRLTYFKSNGSYYTHVTEVMACRFDELGCPIMSEVVSVVRAMASSGQKDALPGLILRKGEVWAGLILVELEDRDTVGYPTLVMPLV